MHKILIENDLYFIANRIKEIDDGYFILKNLKSGYYEIHNLKNKGKSTLCFVWRERQLDGRLLDYLRASRVERQEKFLSEMDKENEKVRRARINEIIEKGSESYEKSLHSLKH